jgi:hypothetical protein
MPNFERFAEDSLKVTDRVDAQIATPLSPILLAEATRSAARAREARNAGRLEDELPPALVAILCAHAAVEAAVNAEAFRLDPAWLTANERQSIDAKWAWIVERRTGQPPPTDRGPRQKLRSLTGDRNLIAHFRGVPQPGGGTSVMGPPDSRRGGISRVRSYFDADRAERAVAEATIAIAAIGP